MLHADVAQLHQRHVELVDQPRTAGDQRGAHRRELYLARGAVEQFQPEFGFQLPDRQANRALRQADIQRRAAEAAVPRDRKKGPELTQGDVHLKSHKSIR